MKNMNKTLGAGESAPGLGGSPATESPQVKKIKLRNTQDVRLIDSIIQLFNYAKKVEIDELYYNELLDSTTLAIELFNKYPDKIESILLLHYDKPYYELRTRAEVDENNVPEYIKKVAMERRVIKINDGIESDFIILRGDDDDD